MGRILFAQTFGCIGVPLIRRDAEYAFFLYHPANRRRKKGKAHGGGDGLRNGNTRQK